MDLFEQNTVGFGASGRNGGMATTGMSIGIRAAVAKLGFEIRSALYGAYTEAIDLVEKLVTDEHIDCDFARTGKLNLASKPAHYQGFEKTHELFTTRLGLQTQLSRSRASIGSTPSTAQWSVEKRRAPRGQLHPRPRRGSPARRRDDPRSRRPCEG